MIYSPYDLTCAVSRNHCLDCVGYVRRDAEAIAGNLMLYAAGGRAAINGE